MPFTPFHFGPGILAKSILRRRFSLPLFVFIQVATDLETLFFILKGEAPLHRFVHSYAGATVMIVVGVIVGRPLCRLIVRSPITLSAAVLSSAVGSYSHVFLDSLMHGDLRPFYPVSAANPMLRAVGLTELHLFCIASGIVGAALLVIFYIGRPKIGFGADSASDS